MALLSVCNPLLDIVAEVPASLLDEYGITHGGAGLANEKQMTLIPRLMKEFSCNYMAGGCGQNTIRVYQALSKKRGATKFIGCVGKDKEAQQLRKLLEEQGVKAIYKVHKNLSTGTCMVLINNKERSLCTYLGASADIDESFLEDQSAEIDDSKAIYCTGFLISTASKVLLKLAKHCQQKGKLFACNLSAEFLIQNFKSEYKDMLRMASITCGNKAEATKLAEVHGLGASDSTGELASKILECMLTGVDEGPNKTKMVVITQGADPVIVASRMSNGTISIASYPVPEISADKIVDLNGAGDAFVGGLLYGVMHDMGIESAVELGNFCAQNVIQRSGFSFDLTDCPYLK